MHRLLPTTLLVLATANANADQLILAPDVFLRETFAAATPEPKLIWLDAATQDKLKAIFGHVYPQARLRYWRAEGRTAWVLEDIGKEFPITAGFVVGKGEVEAARVLVYRESRGDEIRYPSFLKQFRGAKLGASGLQPEVDAISGATLSVWAMARMARAALTLDALVPP
ncbi:MAG: hypothetical protein NVS9B10_28820 [Nevskia sp.]